MVRRARRSAPQWDSGMPMVPLKPRESGDIDSMDDISVSLCVYCNLLCLETADCVSVSVCVSCFPIAC